MNKRDPGTSTQDRTFTLPGDEADNAAEPVADWLAASKRSLQEVWDNDEDSVYDRV